MTLDHTRALTPEGSASPPLDGDLDGRVIVLRAQIGPLVDYVDCSLECKELCEASEDLKKTHYDCWCFRGCAAAKVTASGFLPVNEEICYKYGNGHEGHCTLQQGIL